MTDRSYNKLLLDVCFSLAGLALTGYLGYRMLSILGSTPESAEPRRRQRAAFQKLGIPDLRLTPYEEIIGAELLVPEELQTSFEDVAGYDAEIREIRASVVDPLNRRAADEPDLLRPPAGVLLYGPPGCGKTMLARCVARSCSARFINIQLSSLMDKYFGESEKLARALFSLAHKIQPCIIFMDEIDAVLRERRADTHEGYSSLRSQLLALWDGIQGSEGSRIVVMGATNRPRDIDKAFLRRLPLKIEVGLPDEASRREILHKYLSKAPPHVKFSDYSRMLATLAEFTDGYTGSSLKDLVKFTLLDASRAPGASTDATPPVTLGIESFWRNIEKYSQWSNIY